MRDEKPLASPWLILASPLALAAKRALLKEPMDRGAEENVNGGFSVILMRITVTIIYMANSA